jgi:hypothetical protein
MINFYDSFSVLAAFFLSVVQNLKIFTCIFLKQNKKSWKILFHLRVELFHSLSVFFFWCFQLNKKILAIQYSLLFAYQNITERSQA